MSPLSPRVLTIAGSDCSGGAGIQADLKTFAAHRVYGMSVVTAVTAQNTLGVFGVHPVPPRLVTQQIDVVFDDIGVDAVKIGMLFDRSIVEAVAEALGRHCGPPIVLDTVMISKSGAQLLEDEAVESLREVLIPLATIVTPNLPEAARLTGMPIGTESEREAVAERLAEECGSVLLKGGHAAGSEIRDLLVTKRGLVRFVHHRINTTSTHGTGCTVSAAIAAQLGMGADIEYAVDAAIEYTTGAIEAAVPLGQGSGPIDHLYRMDALSGEKAS
ncbi:MAG: bifunctional hydroxymethylpyrimidine kinase/phosphomethylpyrimidine kinase [Thermoanaerobaculia bacterium]